MVAALAGTRTEVVESTVPTAVHLSGVSKRFGEITAVDGVSLEVPAGSFVTLLGPSGCGKTTLLRILAGFEEPTTGTILIDGRDMARIPPERRPVNLVFQRYALFPHKNVLSNVLFGLEASGTPHRESDARARHILQLCRIDDLAGRQVSELSGGQAQRVAVARALVNRPQVLLLDEPLAALDLKLRRHLQTELRRLQRELGMTFIYVTHDQGEALSMSDSIVLMNKGKIVQHSPPRELYDWPVSVFAATFIGDANMIACTVVAGSGCHDVVRLGRVEVAVTNPTAQPLPLGAQATLCVRPENVRLGPSDQAPLQGRIVDVTFQGPVARYTIDVTEIHREMIAELVARRGEGLYAIGDDVGVTFDQNDALVLVA